MTANLNLILASTSRYRRELLERLGYPFETKASSVDETPLEGETPDALALRLAKAKARAVAREADIILLVADPTPFGFHDFRLAHQAFRPVGRPIAAAINRSGAEGNAEGDEAVRAYCRENGIPLLAELPFEKEAAQQYAAGRLLSEISPAWRERFEKLRDALIALGAEGAAEESNHA